MNMKIVGISVCMLLIATVLPVAETVNVSGDEVNPGDAIDSVDWWPMFHHDLQNTGLSTSPAPNVNKVLWSHTTGNAIIGLSSPAVVDDKLYIGSLGPIGLLGPLFHMGESHFLDALLDVLHGNKNSIYNYLSQFFLDFIDLDFIRGNKAPLQWPGRVYCLDAETGSEIWAKTIEGFVVASPTVYDGKVYIPSISISVNETGYLVMMGNFFCLDATNGNEIWNHSLGEWEAVPGSSPAVADGKVYIPSIEAIINWTYPEESVIIGKFLCLNATNGNEIWNHSLGEWEAVPGSSPAVADGKVYTPSIEAIINWTYPEESVIIGKFLCLNATNGNEIWNHSLGEWEAVPGSSPAVADGKIYIPSIEVDIDLLVMEGKFLCLDAEDGDEIWNHSLGEWEAVPGSSPAVADGKIYIPSIEVDIDLEVIVGKFLCLDAEDGDEIWSHSLGEWEAVPGSSPAVADGKVYTPSIEAIINWTYPEESVIIGKFLCLDAEDGDEIWSYTFGEWEGVPCSSPAVADGKVYIPSFEVIPNWEYPEESVINGMIYAFGGGTELEIGAITGGFGVAATINNIGDTDAENALLEIHVEGGILGFINKTRDKTIDIKFGESENISSGLLFGFGKIDIMVTADADNADEVTETKTGFVLGPFVFGIK